VLAKTRRSLELLRELAEQRQAALLIALLPSFDLVFPQRAASASEPTRVLLQHNPNVNVRAALLSTLLELGIPHVDLLERFRADGRAEIYASDYHIYVEGHRRVADALLEPVLAAAPGRRGAPNR
jgi:hypothetical protein